MKIKDQLKIGILIFIFLPILVVSFQNCAPAFSTLDLNSAAPEAQLAEPSVPAPGGSPSPAGPTSPPAVPTPPLVALPEPIPVNNTPAWMHGKLMNSWIPVPVTEINDPVSGKPTLAGGAALFAFSGLALKESTTELIVAAAGGHGDSSDNRVVSLVLATDKPKWVLRSKPSTKVKLDVSHYDDGLPSSRHTYQSVYVIESLNRVFMYGARGVFGSAYSYTNVDAFNLSTNTWDPANTWESVPTGGGYGTIQIPGSEDVYTTGLFKWSAGIAKQNFSDPRFVDPTQKLLLPSAWSNPKIKRTNSLVRFPIAYDSRRNQLFSLQWADGFGSGGQQVYSSRIPLGTNTQIDVTINPSEAFSQFTAEKPTLAAMGYDPDHDRFLFFHGRAPAVGRIYVIKPNETNNWDMSILPLATPDLPPVVSSGGINSNFKYVPALKGFVLLVPPGPITKPAQYLYFIKTAL